MIIWTLQKAAILNHIQQSGFYQPDFSMSPFLWDKPELAKPYARVLQAFNRHNQTSLPGLIFGFTASDNRCIYDLPTAEDFCRHMAPRMDAIRSLWRNLTERQNCVLMQLEYPDNINPVFIDINDFQFLMPPLHSLPSVHPGGRRAVIRSDRHWQNRPLCLSQRNYPGTSALDHPREHSCLL